MKSTLKISLKSQLNQFVTKLKYIYPYNFKYNRKNPVNFEIAAIKSIKFEGSYNVSDVINKFLGH